MCLDLQCGCTDRCKDSTCTCSKTCVPSFREYTLLGCAVKRVLLNGIASVSHRKDFSPMACSRKLVLLACLKLHALYARNADAFVVEHASEEVTELCPGTGVDLANEWHASVDLHTICRVGTSSRLSAETASRPVSTRPHIHRQQHCAPYSQDWQ